MASLIMTVDSSDDEGVNKKINQQKKTKNKFHKRSTEDEEDFIFFEKDAKNNQDNNIFFESDSDSKENNHVKFLKKDDGTLATNWNFGAQFSLEKKEIQVGEQDENIEKQKEFTFQMRVDKALKNNSINIKEQAAEFFNTLNSEQEKKDWQIHETHKNLNQALIHYDKEDLIQFTELNLSKPLVRACSDLQYEHPTIIQRMVIPAILEGHDVLAHSVTGSGKTASYLLPILQKYIKKRQTQSTEMGKVSYLILQPTRELAAQSHSMLQSLSKYMPVGFSSVALFGGSSLRDQRRIISYDSPDLVVATTGRLIDHIQNTKGFNLEDVDILVLDEADRLLEMGFKDELLNIVKQCKNPKRQTLMFSATLNQDLKQLALLALNKPMQFSVDRQQRKAESQSLKLTQYMIRLQFDGLKEPKNNNKSFDAIKKIKNKKSKSKKRLDPDHPDFDSEEEYGNQVDSESDKSNQSEKSDEEENDSYVEDEQINKQDQKEDEKQKHYNKKFEAKNTPPDEYLIKRESTLLAILKRSFKNRVIIFANEKVQCTRLMALLTIFGFRAAEVHSNISQEERLKSIEQFQQGKVDYLIGTDVVARGLDIPNVRAVINFSFPTEPKRYLHRIGRTARAGQHGVAITLCNEEERKDLKKLSRKLNQNVNTFTVQNKFIQNIYELIKSKLDSVVKQIQCEIQNDKEMREAMLDIQRTENIIKYKDEIMRRPRKEWFIGDKQKIETKKESKQDLKNIKDNYENQLNSELKNSKQKEKKRNKKAQQKEEQKKQKPVKGESLFKNDMERGKKNKLSEKDAASVSKNKFFKKKKHQKKQ